MERTSIKLTCAALDEQGTEIVLRGVIDPASLTHLRVADYQREILPDRRISELMKALQMGGVPDLQLGCRGGNFRAGNESDTFYVQDDVYIIDGLQRRTAAVKLMEKGIIPRIGAMVSFNTTEDIERKRFRALNVTRVKLSPNVLLRNMRHESPAIQALNQLCSSSQFALYKRVCWQQRMKREELITAMMMLQACSLLHSRFGIGMSDRSMVKIVASLDSIYDKIGRATLMGNVRAYWEALDKAYEFQNITYKESNGSLRGGFLNAIARVFSAHQDFWRDAEFSVPLEIQRKLKSFPMADPSVRALCVGTGPSIMLLANLIIEHINSGKRTRRLRPFIATGLDQVQTRDDNHDEEAA
jgi:hypothetical protein